MLLGGGHIANGIVQVIGYEDFLQKLTQMANLADNASSKLEDAVVLFMDEVDKNYDSMIYQTPESPNYKRTGNLWKGTYIKSRTNKKTIVSNKEDYHFYVEYGTKNMFPRPAIRLALEALKAKGITVGFDITDIFK